MGAQIKENSLASANTFAEQQISNGNIKVIQAKAKQIFETVRQESSVTLTDDEQFLIIVEKFYETFPLKIRVILGKKRFNKIMLALRDKFAREKCRPSDMDSEEIITAEIRYIK